MRRMRSMTGYGQAQTSFRGARLSVEINSVNRKQSDVVVSVPRELAELESRVRDAIHAEISRGRLTAIITAQYSPGAGQRPALDLPLARAYHSAMLDLQRELGVPGEISIQTILSAPGVLRMLEDQLSPLDLWPSLQLALREALAQLVSMREREGKNLAKDLVKRLKIVREAVREIHRLHPAVAVRYRETLRERLQRAGLPLPEEDERLVKEIVFFAERSDITEELTRLESHFAECAHHLRREEPVGRTLEFIAQEIGRELNTVGAKANDAAIAQLVVTCKSEMEKIREQIQNIE